MVCKELIRRRVIQIVVFLVALFLLPEVVTRLWPEYAVLIPPPLLLLLITMTIFNALLTWKTTWLLKAMFGTDHEADGKFYKVDSRHYAVSAVISAIVSLALLYGWFESAL
jgi:hypothetical protein